MGSLKVVAKDDFTAFEHLKNSESHFQNCFLEKKKLDDNTPAF